ncbi:MAG: hypothetical protein IKW96_06055 [Ruminococcus sp.]|uniref:hypothetical protein n=1 Tax=Ruminococcus sp. TaxID=41978 RepID=UPI0025FF1AD3|nr:hypothetical protein [Ruminococcus sp.]MBR5682825.1 hypothetical protein [Ruminococcus sp.]
MKYTAKLISADNKKELSDFLSLPGKLYKKSELMQDRAEEKALLRGSHILRRYFRVFPVIARDESGKVAARCAVTIYPDRSSAYFGFFECINDIKAAQALMKCAESIAKKEGKTSLTGPVDCSFWIRYRLKTDNFGSPYTGEPYNLDYYEKLLCGCGLESCGEYISNRYGRIPAEYSDGRFSRRLPQFTEKGYELKSPDNSTFERSLREIYRLIMELYSDFQTFSPITEDEFAAIYSPLKKIVDYSMVKVAYFHGEAVGFFVSVPDFGNAVRGSITPAKLLKILSTKKKCRQYILLYLGIKPEHKGLGKALSEALCQNLADNGADSVGALIRAGKVNGSYFSQLIKETYSYRLYSKDIA